MKPDSFTRMLNGARRDARRSPLMPDDLPHDGLLATRVMAGYREIMREREEAWGIWLRVLRGAWIGLAVISLPMVLWANTHEAAPPSALDVFVIAEPLPPSI